MATTRFNLEPFVRFDPRNLGYWGRTTFEEVCSVLISKPHATYDELVSAALDARRSVTWGPSDVRYVIHSMWRAGYLEDLSDVFDTESRVFSLAKGVEGHLTGGMLSLEEAEARGLRAA